MDKRKQHQSFAEMIAKRAPLTILFSCNYNLFGVSEQSVISFDLDILKLLTEENDNGDQQENSDTAND
jgi:hypothetical protein